MQLEWPSFLDTNSTKCKCLRAWQPSEKLPNKIQNWGKKPKGQFKQKTSQF